MPSATEIVDAVLKELSNRKGFDWWWDDIDADVKAEIRDSLIEKVVQCLASP